MFYNTTNLNIDQVRIAEEMTSEQDANVFQIFYLHPYFEYDSHQIEDIISKYPRSSIVRSLNTLENKKLIMKTGRQKIGKYGKLVNTYILNSLKEQQLKLL